MGEHGRGDGLGERGSVRGSHAPTVPPRGPRYVDGVSLDDLTLVVRAQEGDVRAFEALARRHQAALYRTAVRVTGDRRRGRGRPAGGAAGRLAPPRPVPRRRGVLDVDVPPGHQPLRRRAAPPPTEPAADAGADVAAPDSPERAALLDLELAALGRAVQDLPDDLRVCWVLRELEGLGYGEIAEITGVGETAVRGRIHRARARLAGVMRAWQ